MKKLTAEKCREQFEEWMTSLPGFELADVERRDDGKYSYSETEWCWKSWQASREALEIALPVLEQQESQCQKCGGTGMADSGGTQPWGEPILIECDCQFEQQEKAPGKHQEGE